jgi:alkylhydroperoxidase family enzyme
MRYDRFRKRLTDAVVNGPGDTSPALRQAVMDRATGQRDGVPPELQQYVDTVARHAYKVTDGDVQALQRTGHSDDALFEITVAAAVGAALHRLDRGLAALRGEEPD